MTKTPSLLTIKEFATLVRVHPVTVSRWTARGEVRCVRVGGVVRIDAREVERLCQSHAGRGAT
jgi:excisionase family DNA binding protein